MQAGDNTLALLRLALLYLAVAVFRRLLAVASAYLTQDVRWRATNRLRGDLVRHCLRLGMPFHDAHTPGHMIERIDGDVLALSNFLSAFLLQLVVNGLLLLGTLFALALVSPILGVAFAAYALVTILLMHRTGSLAVPYWRAERAAGAEVSGFLEERLAGTEDIRTCAAEAHTLHGYYDVMRRQFLSSASGFSHQYGSLGRCRGGVRHQRRGRLSAWPSPLRRERHQPRHRLHGAAV